MDHSLWYLTLATRVAKSFYFTSELDFNVPNKLFPSFYFFERFSIVYGDDVICMISIAGI